MRSVGYSDLFSLSKDDLWEALAEYPEARRVLLDTGRQILEKDNMIDPKLAQTEAAADESTTEKVVRLQTELESVRQAETHQIRSDKSVICPSCLLSVPPTHNFSFSPVCTFIFKNIFYEPQNKQDRELNWIAEPEHFFHFTKSGIN